MKQEKLDELHRNLLMAMDDIAWRMPEEIYLHHWDAGPANRKYTLATFEDAFKSLELFCEGMKISAITQCGMILRLLLEQTAIAKTLTQHQELLNEYVHHYKFRIIVNDLSINKRNDEIRKEFAFDEKVCSPLQFLDYGWLGNGIEKEKNKEDSLIIRAGLGDILAWKKRLFDKFSHQSFNSTSTLNPAIGSTMIYPYIDIAAKLADELCCAFHSLTNFDFVWDGESKFQDIFRPRYKKFIDFKKSTN